ncbi:MAG: PD40 domain-containing protein [Anaerolineae bacterium]|nr:PD40 domain-containing protein [Anaerolineae bacterium]
MSKGKIYQDPQFKYIDSYSEREVVQLTNYLGHSHHLYFTDDCWINNGRSFVFISDRENAKNFFRYDLDAGTITQLTDLKGTRPSSGYYGEPNHAFYFWAAQVLYELNMDTLEERAIYEIPSATVTPGRPGVTADGKSICSMLSEYPPEDKPQVAFSYSQFREHFRNPPLAQMTRIEIATGKAEVILEDRRYMTHVNPSPVLPDIMTYCHEGPWQWVDQRMWGLNIQTGETWKIRPQDGSVSVGHEYWFSDGERIGYHGSTREEDEQMLFGFLKWDNNSHVERQFPFRSIHFHSLNEDLIVGDGTPAFVFSNAGLEGMGSRPFIQLFKWNGEQYIGPKILSFHRSTFNDQHAHCHPRFTPDGKSVLYTSDLTAYSNMYLVEVGDFDELPDLTNEVR